MTGTLIAKEGHPSDIVYIIVKGEAELFRTNFDSVYFNHETSIIGVPEYKEDQP